MIPNNDFIARREDHYRRFLGPLTEPVIHPTDKKPVHVDVYQFRPTRKRPYWTFITGGMSDQRQDAPRGLPAYVAPRTEILMYLQAPEPWVYQILKSLAEMPFARRTILHWGHTVPYGQPISPALPQFSSFVLLPPSFESEEFAELELGCTRVDFLWLIPITEAERNFAATKGSAILLEKFKEARVSPIFDPNRASVV